MRIPKTALAAAALLLAGCASAATASAAGARPPSPARCATFVLSGTGKTAAMPWDEPVTFCGPGVPSGSWLCPAETAAIGPGTRLQCRPGG